MAVLSFAGTMFLCVLRHDYGEALFLSTPRGHRAALSETVFCETVYSGCESADGHQDCFSFLLVRRIRIMELIRGC